MGLRESVLNLETFQRRKAVKIEGFDSKEKRFLNFGGINLGVQLVKKFLDLGICGAGFALPCPSSRRLPPTIARP
jgi:hypothetical protein